MRARLLVAALMMASLPGRAATCGLQLVAQSGLRDTDGFLSVPVGLDRTVSMLVDTGSDAGLLSPQVAQGWRRIGAGATALGSTGGIRDVPVSVAPQLVVGDLRLSGVPFPLGALPQAPRIAPPIEGLIGADLLSRFEVEIDVPDGLLLLFEGHRLSRLCRGLPPWTGRYETVQTGRSGDRVTLPVSLNGRTFTAVLDSGARSRIVSRRAAIAAGVDAGTLEGEPGGITSGVDGRREIYHWHRFDEFGVGDEIERRPVLTVTRLADDTAVLLGADWFARHRVWISYATSQLFFQAVGQR